MRDYDSADALDRARTEVLCELRRWSRRLVDRANEIAKADLVHDPDKSPEEVGRAAAKRALDEKFYVEPGETPPALPGRCA